MLSPLLSLDVPAVIAHRGGSGLRPENTMVAFEHAHALGVDALECDVHLSRDGEVVVIHDATLERTTDGAGPVSSFSAAELAHVDAGAKFDAAAGFPYRGRGIGVPRLADLLTRFDRTPIVIEIKGERTETAEAAMDVIRRAGALDRVIVGGFSRTALDAARRIEPGLVTSASRVEVQSAMRRAWVWMRPAAPAYQLFQIPLRFGGRQVLRPYMVRAARRASLPVQAWIVDTPEDMRLVLSWGVTGLITDRPDIAIAEARRFRDAGVPANGNR